MTSTPTEHRTRPAFIDHGDPNLPPVVCPVDETVAVGPLSIFFANQNLPMGLKSHQHAADVWVIYRTLGRHGYPSFESTNDALRARVRELTDRLFTDATNEDVARRIFAHLDGWVAEEWVEWGGDYRLDAVFLDVHSTPDKIGHDDGTTRYTITRSRS